MALNSLYCADVPLSNYSLAHNSFSTLNSVVSRAALYGGRRDGRYVGVSAVAKLAREALGPSSTVCPTHTHTHTHAQTTRPPAHRAIDRIGKIHASVGARTRPINYRTLPGTDGRASIACAAELISYPRRSLHGLRSTDAADA